MPDRIDCLAIVASCVVLAACKAEPESGDFDFGEEGMSTGMVGSADSDPNTPPDDDSDDESGSSGGDTDSGDETGGAQDDGPHALATIVLGESHDPETLTMQASLFATFEPDHVTAAPGCGSEIDGCFVQSIPDCGELGCELGETCVFNDACQSACEPVCDLTCASDEVCYFPVPDVPGCKKLETFDAGTLTFAGTTVPVTLYPPYVLPAGFEGPLALPDDEVMVSASGAAGAGFTAFEATVTATRTMSSSAGQLSLSEAFGEDPLRVAWAPAQDEVVVTLTVAGELGGYGTVVCEGDDAEGSLDVPREAITAAAGGHATSIGVAVERRRSSLHKGVMTRGALLDQVVQPQGWVELVSSSVETATLIGCSASLSACGDVCVDTNYDEAHCGECDNPCLVGEYCSAGVCG